MDSVPGPRLAEGRLRILKRAAFAPLRSLGSVVAGCGGRPRLLKRAMRARRLAVRIPVLSR